jgi:prepilin-type N-terminal cleavage/methylation domain-containing protein
MSHLASVSNERGLTLAEILIAVALLGLGLAALMAIVPVASYGVQDGNQTSTATFLAQQRLEEVRNAVWTATIDCVGVSPNATSAPVSPAGGCGPVAHGTFPDEPAVPGFAQYSRSVRVTDCATIAPPTTQCGLVPHAAMRLVTVSVTYQPMSAAGGSPTNTSVIVEWLVAQRL